MNRGHIKIWRKIEDSGLFGNAEVCQLFLFLMVRATYRPRKIIAGTRIIELRPGQLFAGRKQLAAALGSSEQKIRTALSVLQKHEIISQRPTSKGTVISLTNWDKYQREHPASNRHGIQRPTSAQPALTQRVTTKQEVKKLYQNSPVIPSSLCAPGADVSVPPASVPDAACAGPVSGNAGQEEPGPEPSYRTKKGRVLTGKRYASFNRFWTAFAYTRGKAEAADAWLDIPRLTDPLVERIIAAAEKTAADRPRLMASGGTPKMAQGWISGRRWEDEAEPDAAAVRPPGQPSRDEAQRMLSAIREKAKKEAEDRRKQPGRRLCDS